MTPDAPTVIIEQTITIEARPETVWPLLTEPAGLCAWWGTAAEVDARPGGVFRVTMENGVVMSGQVVELDPPRRLVFTFGWEADPTAGLLPPGSTRVEMRLTGHDGRTVLELRHSDLPPEHAPDHRDGWNHFLGGRLVEVAAS